MNVILFAYLHDTVVRVEGRLLVWNCSFIKHMIAGISPVTVRGRDGLARYLCAEELVLCSIYYFDRAHALSFVFTNLIVPLCGYQGQV